MATGMGKTGKWMLTVLVLLAMGCESQQSSEKESAGQAEKQHDFKAFSAKLKPISLPMRLNCDEELTGASPDFPDTLAARYGKEKAAIFGKLAETDDFTAILYLVPAAISLPVIRTRDKDGNEISELALYERWCGGNETSWVISWALIAKDLTITLKDSAIRFQRNAAGEIIDSTRRTEVKEKIFRIDENGIINEMKGTVKQYPPGLSAKRAEQPNAQPGPGLR